MCIRDRSYAERDRIVEGFAKARALILDAAPSLGWGTAAPADGAFYYYSDLGPQLERHGSATAYARVLLERADVAIVPVSYTHLDVYKRQPLRSDGCSASTRRSLKARATFSPRPVACDPNSLRW